MHNTLFIVSSTWALCCIGYVVLYAVAKKAYAKRDSYHNESLLEESSIGFNTTASVCAMDLIAYMLTM